MRSVLGKVLAVLLSGLIVFDSLPSWGAMLSSGSDFYLKGVRILDTNRLLFLWEGEGSIAEKKEVLSYFLTALAVPNEEWWVNLNVFISDDATMGRGLAHTSLGKVLIDADLKLKERAMELIAYYDDELGREVNSPLRFWIEPKDAKVIFDEDEVKLEEAHLKVRVEAENKEVERVIRETVLPLLDEEVNTSPEFAGLREAFFAMVLASWYKRNLEKRAEILDKTVDSFALPRGKVGGFWSRRDYLRRFAMLYAKGVVSALSFSTVEVGGFLGKDVGEKTKGVSAKDPMSKDVSRNLDEVKFGKDIGKNKKGAIVKDFLVALWVVITIGGFLINDNRILGIGIVGLILSLMSLYSEKIIRNVEMKTEFKNSLASMLLDMMRHNKLRDAEKWSEIIRLIKGHSPSFARFLASRLLAEGIMLESLPLLDREDVEMWGAEDVGGILGSVFHPFISEDVVLASDVERFLAVKRIPSDRQIGEEVIEKAGIYQLQGKVFLGWKFGDYVYRMRDISESERDLFLLLWHFISSEGRGRQFDARFSDLLNYMSRQNWVSKKGEEVLRDLVKMPEFRDAPALKRLIHLASLERRNVLFTDGVISDWLTAVIMNESEIEKSGNDVLKFNMVYRPGWRPVGYYLAEKTIRKITRDVFNPNQYGGIDLNAISISPVLSK